MRSSTSSTSSLRRSIAAGAAITIGLAVTRFGWRTATATQASAAVPLVRELAIHSFWVFATPLVLITVLERWRRDATNAGRVATFIVGAAAVLVLEPLWTYAVLQWTPFADTSLSTLYLARTDLNAIVVALLAGVALAWEREARVEAGMISAARLRRQLAEAQLSALTLQLQPHFLFNTLQLVAETARGSGARAAEIVRDLARLVAESVDHASRRLVSTSEELAILRSYLSIQRTRFEHRLRVQIIVDDDANDAILPRMLLQPLVENAIQHGIGRRASGGEIIISIRREDDRRGPRLVVSVMDDGEGPKRPSGRSGMGLANTRARLTALYGADFSLALSARATGGTEARIDIPLRSALSTNDVAPAASDDSVNAPLTHARWLLALCLVWLAAALIPPLLRLGFGVAGWTSASVGSSVLTAVRDAPFWLLALLTADVLERKWTLTGRGIQGLAIHAVAATAVASLNLVVGLVAPSDADPVAPTISVLRVLATYVASAVLARANAAGHRAAEQSRVLGLLRQDVAEGEAAVARAEVHHSVLALSLQRIEKSCLESPEECRRDVLRFAGLLRSLLEALDNPQHDATADARILRQFVKLVRDTEPGDVALPDTIVPPATFAAMATSLSPRLVATPELAVDGSGSVGVSLAMPRVALADEAPDRVRVLERLLTRALGTPAELVLSAGDEIQRVALATPLAER